MGELVHIMKAYDMLETSSLISVDLECVPSCERVAAVSSGASALFKLRLECLWSGLLGRQYCVRSPCLLSLLKHK